MDYLASFDISASGMAVEKTRLDIVALNLANAKSTRSIEGGPYKALEVISGEKIADFADYLDKASDTHIAAGAQVLDIKQKDVEPKLVYEPKHPDANKDGYVAYPNINPVSEMITLIEATRAYEANVRALNAAKSMALQALDIGKK